MRLQPLPSSLTFGELTAVVRDLHAAVTSLIIAVTCAEKEKGEKAMPCGAQMPSTCGSAPNNLEFECCGRMKVQAYRCEAPTGCGGATFPVGLQLNVNEWPPMGDYPVYALKLFDCVGGKASVGFLGAVNGTVKYGVDVKIPDTPGGAAIQLTIVNPVTGEIVNGQSTKIGITPSSTTGSATGTTQPSLVLDSGLTVKGPFEATIGIPDETVWEGFWTPSTNNNQGILFTTEQRSWNINGAKLDTGITVVKTREDDGFTFSVIDPLHHSTAMFCGTHPDTDTVVTAMFMAPMETPATAGAVHAAVWTGFQDGNFNGIQDGIGGLSVITSDGSRYAGYFMGNIYVHGNATLGGQAFGDWADYALAPDYDLMDMEALKNYIAEHQHLPGIPSAEAVREKGVSMQDMFRNLLLKIEEITLYVLDLNTRLSLLESEM